jgi:very-short-patch-repair endonuclease
MKMFNIFGDLVNADVRESTYPLKARSKSILQQKVKERLIEKFPREQILEEFILPGSRLSLDLIIIKLRKAFEIDGDQHLHHNYFFHGDRNSGKFAKQISNDRKKDEWCEMNGIELIRIYSEEDMENKI